MNEQELMKRIADLEKELEALREENRWYTSNEIIPDGLSKVLVYDARFKRIELKHCTVEKFLRQGRTHWHRLPSVPK